MSVCAGGANGISLALLVTLAREEKQDDDDEKKSEYR